MHKELTDHLGWTPGLERLTGGSSSLLDGIAVFIDFDWIEVIGHKHRTFPNYLALGRYIRKNTRPGKKTALILTNQTKGEGCHLDHSTHDIFILNINHYRKCPKDAAGAYFAGLVAAPLVRERLSEEELASVLDQVANQTAIGAWLERHPVAKGSIVASLGSVAVESVGTDQLIAALMQRLPDMEAGDRECLQSLLQAQDFPVNILRTVQYAKRSEAVAEFKRELKQGVWKEKHWQRFFSRERWIFGHHLLYQFLEVMEAEAYVGAKGMSNTGGQVADYIARTRGVAASFSTLVDIKVPQARLVKEKEYRNGVHAIDDELAGGVAQILGNCNTWNREGSRQDGNLERAHDEGWQTAQPRGILVIGDTQSLTTRLMKQSFELFRRHLHGVEILTFDELLIRAEELVQADLQPSEAYSLALSIAAPEATSPMSYSAPSVITAASPSGV